MSGNSGSPEEPAPKTIVRREIENLALFNHHREEVREARARWWQAVERAAERSSRALELPRRAD